MAIEDLTTKDVYRVMAKMTVIMLKRVEGHLECAVFPECLSTDHQIQADTKVIDALIARAREVDPDNFKAYFSLF